jgi:hypothetical protein
MPVEIFLQQYVNEMPRNLRDTSNMRVAKYTHLCRAQITDLMIVNHRKRACRRLQECECWGSAVFRGFLHSRMTIAEKIIREPIVAPRIRSKPVLTSASLFRAEPLLPVVVLVFVLLASLKALEPKFPAPYTSEKIL